MPQRTIAKSGRRGRSIELIEEVAAISLRDVLLLLVAMEALRIGGCVVGCIEDSEVPAGLLVLSNRIIVAEDPAVV